MRTAEVKNFIDDHGHLFWYSPAPKSETVSDELLVESMLNYGTWEEVHDLFKIVGLRKVASVFYGMTGRKKLNFFPKFITILAFILQNMHPNILNKEQKELLPLIRQFKREFYIVINSVKITFFQYPYEIEANVNFENTLQEI